MNLAKETLGFANTDQQLQGFVLRFIYVYRIWGVTVL